jgi:hypothetical protein
MYYPIFMMFLCKHGLKCTDILNALWLIAFGILNTKKKDGPVILKALDVAYFEEQAEYTSRQGMLKAIIQILRC